MSRKNTCENCAAWEEVQRDPFDEVMLGYCRRHPPTVRQGRMQFTEDPMPIISQDEWCFDHIEKGDD